MAYLYWSIAPVIEMNSFNYLMHCPCIMYHNYALDTMCWDKYTTFATNNLIQSNRSVFLLMQNYSQAFLQAEISNVIFAVVFAIRCRPQHFDNWNVQKRKRERLYQKYLRDKFLFQKNYYHSFNNRKPQNVWEKVIIVTLYYVYWVIRSASFTIFGFVIHELRNR